MTPVKANVLALPAAPSPIEKWFIDCERAAQNAPHQSSAQWVDQLQEQLRHGRECNLNIIFASLNPRLKKSLYLAAHLSRADLDKPLNELTGPQRQQVFIALQRFQDVIVQLQKAGAFCLDAFQIAELTPLEPAEQAEIDRIQKLKQQRYDQQNQQYQQTHGLQKTGS